jgi:hypothetical protein
MIRTWHKESKNQMVLLYNFILYGETTIYLLGPNFASSVANVKSVLLYGSETRKVAKITISKLQVFVNRCLRRILNIHWPEVISNEELWRRVEETEISIQIKRRKWNWIGHTLRKGHDTIEREVLDWNPQGQRRRGRPKQTRRRSVHNEALGEGKSWGEVKQLARNRIRWRRFVDALCP